MRQLQVHNLIHSVNQIDNRIGMAAQNQEIHKVDYQLAEDNRKLIPRNQCSRILLGAISAIYIGQTADASPTPTPPKTR